MSAVSGKNVDEIIQNFQPFCTQQTTKLQEIADKITSMDLRLGILEGRVAGLEARVRIEAIEGSPAEKFYNEGRLLVERKRYPDAVEAFKKGLEEECDDDALKGKLFRSLFKVLISLKRDKEIPSYQEALGKLFEKAQGPDEERVKAAATMCQSPKEADPSCWVYPSYFIEKEKFDEHKGILLFCSAWREIATRPRTNESNVELLLSCLKYKLPAKKRIFCLLGLLEYLPDSEIDTFYWQTKKRDLTRQSAEEALSLLELPELSTWGQTQALKIIARQTLEGLKKPKTPAPAPSKSGGWFFS